MKKKLAALAICLGLVTSSCLGPNKTFRDLHDWNEDVSDTTMVNELVFFGLNIIPVYPIVYLVDILVINSIDYWSGDDDE